jgi:hypothetical protein
VLDGSGLKREGTIELRSPVVRWDNFRDMYAAGTRVKLLIPIDGHPAGSEAVVVYDLGDDICQISLDTGAQVTVVCSALEPVDVAETAAG